MATIFEQLLRGAQKAGIDTNPKGTAEQVYLLQLIQGVGTLSDENYYACLNKAAQEWITVAIEAVNTKNPIPFCPGYVNIEDAAPQEKPKKAQPLKTTLKPLKKKKGALHSIRETIILNPEWSNKEVFDHVIKEWPATKPETVAVNGSDIRHTIALAKELGYWKSE